MSGWGQYTLGFVQFTKQRNPQLNFAASVDVKATKVPLITSHGQLHNYLKLHPLLVNTDVATIADYSPETEHQQFSQQLSRDWHEIWYR